MLSWTVRGLNNAVKRHKVYSYLRSLQAEIIFVQETHAKDIRALIKPAWAAQLYPSNFQLKQN